MAEFIVVVERKIVRYLRVSAKNAAAARVQIMGYGEMEAWSDYTCVEDIEKVRIVTVKRDEAATR